MRKKLNPIWLHKPEVWRKISITKKGTKPWNTGKKWSDEVKKKFRLAKLKNPIRYWLNKKRYPETIEKMRQAKLRNPVRYWLGKKMPMITGENHFNWNGGSSFEPYSRDWNSELKRRIRYRDNFTCICGNYGYNVHHIDYNKKNCNPDNLVTLCDSCHGKTNHSRDYWRNQLTISLSYLEGYS